jgi:hypothetical protein
VHPTLGILARFQAFFYASAFFQSDGVPPPAPARVTQTVGQPLMRLFCENYAECEDFVKWYLSCSLLRLETASKVNEIGKNRLMS